MTGQHNVSWVVVILRGDAGPFVNAMREAAQAVRFVEAITDWLRSQPLLDRHHPPALVIDGHAYRRRVIRRRRRR